MLKTAAQAAIYGGTAGAQYDPCYHAACDTFANNNLHALAINSDAVAFAVLTYAYSTETVNGVRAACPASSASRRRPAPRARSAAGAEPPRRRTTKARGLASLEGDRSAVALASAVSLARSLGAELVIIAIVGIETFATPVAMGSPGLASLRSDIERHAQEELHKVAAGIPADVTASTKRLTGDAEQLLTEQTEELDILVTGSRGYGPLRAVLAGGLERSAGAHVALPGDHDPARDRGAARDVRDRGRRRVGGRSDEAPPEPLDAAIIFAPDGALVPAALAVLAPAEPSCSAAST